MNIIYKKAEPQELKGIPEVHMACFPSYFLTSLGPELLEKYYLEFYNESQLFIIACDSDRTAENKIIGFCMGYYKGSQARSVFESKYRTQLVRRLLGLCIRLNGPAITRCISRVKALFHKNRGSVSQSHADADLLSICVMPEYRGQSGVAVGLITEFEKLMAEQKDGHITSCTLSVRSDNGRARALYEKCGFHVWRQTKEELTYIKYYEDGPRKQE